MVTSFVLPSTPLYEHLTSLYKSTSLRLIEGGGGVWHRRAGMSQLFYNISQTFSHYPQCRPQQYTHT